MADTTEVISVSVRPSDLAVIDRAAALRGLSRSAYLVAASMVTARLVFLREERAREAEDRKEAEA